MIETLVAAALRHRLAVVLVAIVTLVWGALSLVLLVVASGPILFLMLIFGALG